MAMIKQLLAFMKRENEDDYVQFTAQTRVPILVTFMTISHNITSIPMLLPFQSHLNDYSDFSIGFKNLRIFLIILFLVHTLPGIALEGIGREFGVQHEKLGIQRLDGGQWILSEDVVKSSQPSTWWSYLKEHYVTFQLCTVLCNHS
jgi:hypothetical protein